MKSSRALRLLRLVTAAAALIAANAIQAAPAPQVGDDAPQFVLQTLDEHPVDFAQVARGRTAILVVLRGWPGYQCPFCTTQVYEYVGHAAEFAARDIPVVMIYPGPAEQLRAHAREFLGDKRWPANFHFVLDPDYEFAGRYGLRWEAKGETVYPSTLVVGPAGKITFAHVSREHGDRVGAAALLRILAEKK
jgi:peroxiredoxin